MLDAVRSPCSPHIPPVTSSLFFPFSVCRWCSFLWLISMEMGLTNYSHGYWGYGEEVAHGEAGSVLERDGGTQMWRVCGRTTQIYPLQWSSSKVTVWRQLAPVCGCHVSHTVHLSHTANYPDTDPKFWRYPTNPLTLDNNQVEWVK